LTLDLRVYTGFAKLRV